MANKSNLYLGNHNLKASNVPQEFTKEQVEEYLKCAADPLYFIKEYVKIITLDEGLQPFEPWDFQEDLLEKVHDNRFVICKFPRQTGKSTTVVSYILHYILFNPEVNVAILANKLATARELLNRLKLAYEHLPKWLQQGIEEWNKTNIELENNSKVIAAATSSSAVRGGSFNMIFLDEFAYVPPGVAEEFFSSVYPTISSGKETKVLIVSTPKGLNMFYKMWIDAEEGRSEYVPVEVHWNQVPGRDDKWKQQTIANTSEEQFRVEFECDFIGSTQTLIDSKKLKCLTWKTPVEKTDDGVKVYEKSKEDHQYVMCVDVSRGKELDYHAITVIDITETPYKVVCSFRNNTMSPMVLPNLVYRIGNKYNTAHALIEINDIGAQVADILHHELEYDNILVTSVRGRKGQTLDGGFGSAQSQLGVRTTKAVKRLGCSIIKSMVEEDKIVVEDFDTIEEMVSFVSKANSYEAEKGHHDDLMMTLVLFGWLSTQSYFKDLTNFDLRKNLFQEKIQKLEDELTPFGFIDDGINLENGPEIDSNGDAWYSANDRDTDFKW
tara:strand:- start:18250 stop:19902 length:1653 start_codon:yes stop_codon:yes gene_type:complete